MLILTLYPETTRRSFRSDGTAASLKQLVFLAAAIFTHRMQLRVKNEGRRNITYHSSILLSVFFYKLYFFPLESFLWAEPQHTSQHYFWSHLLYCCSQDISWKHIPSFALDQRSLPFWILFYFTSLGLHCSNLLPHSAEHNCWLPSGKHSRAQ